MYGIWLALSVGEAVLDDLDLFLAEKRTPSAETRGNRW
jgi:hypothetical protein